MEHQGLDGRLQRSRRLFRWVSWRTSRVSVLGMTVHCLKAHRENAQQTLSLVTAIVGRDSRAKPLCPPQIKRNNR